MPEVVIRLGRLWGYGARDRCPACPVRPTHFTRLVADAGEPVGQRTGDSKRWLAHIFHASPCPPPVPKWRNDAIPRTHGSRRAPESHAPATFFLPADALRTEVGPPKTSIAHPPGAVARPGVDVTVLHVPGPGEVAHAVCAGAPGVVRVSAPGGGVLVMSSGLALRQVGSRESSASGFRRAGLAWREPGSARAGPGLAESARSSLNPRERLLEVRSRGLPDVLVGYPTCSRVK